MKNTKKLIALIVAVALVCAMFAGCSAKEVAATVNGKQITMEEYKQELNAVLYYYGTDDESLEDFLYQSYGDEAYAKSEAAAFRDSVLDSLITNKLLEMKAEELGLSKLSEDEMAEIAASVIETMTSYKEYYTGVAEEEAAEDDSIDKDARAEELYNEFIQGSGLSEEYLTEVMISNYVSEKVYNHYLEEFEITEEDHKGYYDELLADQQAMDEESPDTALYYYLNYGYDLNVYIPKNAEKEVKTVKHILVAIDEETQEDISTLAASEDGADEAEKMQEEALEAIKDKAQEILDKALAGEDFDALMKEHSADYHEDGKNTYDVYEGGNFVEEFTEASLALENIGDISDLTASTYGWHIIMLDSVPKSGPIPYEDVKEDIIALADTMLENEYWQGLISEWLDEADVTRISFIEELELAESGEEEAEETEAEETEAE